MNERVGGFSALFGRGGSKGRQRSKPPSPLTLSTIIRPHPDISSPVTTRSTMQNLMYRYPNSSPIPYPQGSRFPLESGVADPSVLDSFPAPPGMSPVGTSAPSYHLIGRTHGPRPSYTLHSPLGERLPVPVPRTDSLPPSPHNPLTTPPRRYLPPTPPDSTYSPESPRIEIRRPSVPNSPPAFVQPPRTKVTFATKPATRTRSVEYSSSCGSSYHEPTENSGDLRRSSSGSRSGFPRGWLTQMDQGWMSEENVVSGEGAPGFEADDGFPWRKPARSPFGSDSPPESMLESVGNAYGGVEEDIFRTSIDDQRRKERYLPILSPVDDSGNSDADGSTGSRFSSSSSDDGANIEVHLRSPFPYALSSEGHDDRRKADLRTRYSLVSPLPPRSPGIQPLHLPLRTRPVTTSPTRSSRPTSLTSSTHAKHRSLPYSNTYRFSRVSTLDASSPRGAAFPTRPDSTLVPLRRPNVSLPYSRTPPMPHVLRRPSSPSALAGLKELVFRTQPLNVKKTRGVQVASKMNTAGTQTDPDPPRPTFVTRRPLPLRLAMLSPANSSPSSPSFFPGPNLSPASQATSFLTTTDTEFFDTAPASPDDFVPAPTGAVAEDDDDGEDDDSEFRDVSAAQFVPVPVLSPSPVACRASLLPLRRTNDASSPPAVHVSLSPPAVDTPTTPTFGSVKRTVDVRERNRALEEEVERLNRVVRILTGGGRSAL